MGLYSAGPKAALPFIPRGMNSLRRAYGLHRFNIAGRMASESEAGGLRRVSRTRKRLAKLSPNVLPAPDPEVFRERTLRRRGLSQMKKDEERDGGPAQQRLTLPLKRTVLHNDPGSQELSLKPIIPGK
jgi:hypothetical protein